MHFMALVASSRSAMKCIKTTVRVTNVPEPGARTNLLDPTVDILTQLQGLCETTAKTASEQPSSRADAIKEQRRKEEERRRSRSRDRDRDREREKRKRSYSRKRS